jgi:hypothetical protein
MCAVVQPAAVGCGGGWGALPLVWHVRVWMVVPPRWVGRHLILTGHKGHVAVMDTLRQKVLCEQHHNESVRAGVFLHNVSFYALAQKKYVYIYDTKGTEIHVLKSHLQPQALDFLPYHFLLASVGSAGWLKYQVCGVRVCDCVCAVGNTGRRRCGRAPIPTQTRWWRAAVCAPAGHVHGGLGGGAPNQAGQLRSPAAESLQRRGGPGALQRWVTGPGQAGPEPLCTVPRHATPPPPPPAAAAGSAP